MLHDSECNLSYFSGNVVYACTPLNINVNFQAVYSNALPNENIARP